MEANPIKSVNKWDLLILGSEEEFFDGFTHCYDDLYRFGFFLYRDTELSKDCIQLLFIEVWKLRKKSPEIHNAKEYILKIYKRVLYKQKKIMTDYSSGITFIQNNTDFEALTEVENDHQKETLSDHYENEKRLSIILDQLSARQRELIKLRYLEEKSINEMAVITSLTPRTIYNTLHNALVKLREALQKPENL